MPDTPMPPTAAAPELDEADFELPEGLSLPETLAFASRLHQLGQLDPAVALYERVLAEAPDQPDALAFLGIASHQRGDSARAIALLRRSLEIAPRAGGWNNLGNVLLAQRRFDEAGTAYEHCVALEPGNVEVFNNLGVLRRAQRRDAEAEQAYLRALDIDPENPDVHNNLGNLRLDQGRVPEAVAHFCRALLVLPLSPSTRRMLASAHLLLGERDKAAQIFRDWLAAEPDSATARHHLAACTGDDVPERADDAYVEATFDSFADSFESKLASLTYRAPELLRDALARRCGEPDASLSVLDAGCGTGLCGPLIRPWAVRLEGVDLSARMLQSAAQKRVYDGLYKCELTEFLAATPPRWDVVLSADTLCYFGDLRAVLAAARQTLRPPGLLLFTVEALDAASGEDWRLMGHGRYAHSAAYVRRCLAELGYVGIRLDPVDLRTEAGRPVAGLVVEAFRPAEDTPR